jgi:mannose-6-phosphate isomerase
MRKKNMTELKKGAQPRFPKKESVGPRPWGEEELLFVSEGKFMMKKLTVKAGSKGGLQFHRLKDEGGYLVSGEMIIRFDDGAGGLTEKVIRSGACFHFPPGVVHQEEAITDCIIIEGSTPHFNDRVRCEKEYGLADISGLPSTSIKEIEER